MPTSKHRWVTMILAITVLVFFTGCSTVSYHAIGTVDEFNDDREKLLYESPHYAGTKMNGELIIWPYSTHKPGHSTGDFAFDMFFGIFLWPVYLLYGVIDFPFSLIADTVYYPIQLSMENNKPCADDSRPCPTAH